MTSPTDVMLNAFTNLLRLLPPENQQAILQRNLAFVIAVDSDTVLARPLAARSPAATTFDSAAWQGPGKSRSRAARNEPG